MENKRLTELSEFIDKKLQKTRRFNKYTAKLSGTNQDIINSMDDAMRNNFKEFFKGDLFKIRKCEHCNTTDESLQYERAHNKGSDRKKVGLNALNRIRSDESVEILAKDFLKAFIEEHKFHPVWYLCRPCHLKYDKK